MLTPGRYSTLRWSQGGQETGSITLAAQHDGVRLIYQTKDRDGLPVKVDEFVAFSYTPTRSGATEDEYDFPPKPPRMRWATYNRLEAQYDDLQNRWAIGIMARFARFR